MVRLTPDRVRHWHRLKKKRHGQNGEKQALSCIICAWEGGGVPWAAVVQHVEQQGFKILRWDDQWAEVDTGPWHEETGSTAPLPAREIGSESCKGGIFYCPPDSTRGSRDTALSS